MNVPRSRLGLVALDGELYAISGMNGESAGRRSLNAATVESYDPALNVWRIVGSINHPRHGFASIVWHRRIYAFGGNDGDTRRSAEVWDPKTGKSLDLPNIPCDRGFSGVVELGGRLLCFGGRSAGGSISVFDPSKRTWSNSSIPDVERNRFTAILRGTELWLIGNEGRGPVPITESVDLSKDVQRNLTHDLRTTNSTR